MRGLVETAVAGEFEAVEYLPEVLDLSLWQAAKNGITGGQVDTGTGASIAVKELARRLLRIAENALRDHGDYDFAVISLRNMLETGNGAVRQRAAFDRGAFMHLLANAHAEMQI